MLLSGRNVSKTASLSLLFFQWFSPRCFMYFEINTLWGKTHYINSQTLLEIHKE